MSKNKKINTTTYNEMILEDLDEEKNSIIENIYAKEYNVITENTYQPVSYNILKNKQLPAGRYQVLYEPNIGTYIKKMDEFKGDELIDLPSPLFKDILDDVENGFWANKHKYEEYNIVYKRGYLFYGIPGTGKSAFIRKLTEKLINEKNGVVFEYTAEVSMNPFINILRQIRSIEPERPFYVIMEDIDGLIDTNKSEKTRLLQLLDGGFQISNVVFIATTNYINNLPDNIINRPSRFDRREEIGTPTIAEKIVYFKNFLKNDEDFQEVIDNYKYWIIETHNKEFTISHLKELAISVFVQGKDVKDMVGKVSKKITRSFGKPVGFKNANDDGEISGVDLIEEYNIEVDKKLKNFIKKVEKEYKNG